MYLNRRTLLTSASLAVATSAVSLVTPALSATASSAQGGADIPLPGALRRRIGTIEVTALLDGYLDVDEAALVGHDPAVAKQLALDSFHNPGPQRIPVSAYLVNTGDKLILVDAGTSDTFGPTLGKLPAALKAIGVVPADIDILAITHLHPDHIDGALAPDGSALFPNAELVVTEADHRFWHDDGSMNQAEGAMQGFFLGARKGVAAYKSRLRLIADDAEVAPGIRAQALPGHTPGHTGFRIDSGAESLLIWGDVAHLATYQFANPDWALVFDTDVEQARNTRKRVLDQATTDRMMIAGMHLPFPGFGHVAREADGYRFILAEWPYAL